MDFAFMKGDLDGESGKVTVDVSEAKEFSSPYKLSLFLLLSELEKHHQKMEDGFDADMQGFLGILLTFLIRQTDISLPILKCFVLRFIEPIVPSFAENFFKSLRVNSQLGIVPCSEQLFCANRNPNFIRAKSILGMFAQKVQKCYLGRDLYCHAEFLAYLNASASQEELKFAQECWNLNVDTFLITVAEIEEKFSDVIC